MPRIYFLLVFLILCQSAVYAQKTGVVDYPYLGIKFTIPSGWKGQETDDGFLIGSDTHAGLMSLIPHEANSISELEKGAKEGIADGGIFLNLTGDLSKFGAEGLGGEFSGSIEGTQARAYLIGVVNPFGYGVTIVVTTDTEHYSNQYKKWAEQLASSLQFRAPKEPAKTKEWKEWIGGAKLVYMDSNYDSGPSYGGYSTYSSYSSRREILLCSNKRFSYYSSSQFSVDTGGGSVGSNNGDDGQGTWEVSWDAAGKSALELTFNNGEESSYTLEYQDNKTLLNGSRYFVVRDHNECY